MKLTKDEVNQVAHLARLELGGDEVESLTDDMNNILGYIDKLSELDTKNVAPTSHAVPMSNAFRDDEQNGRFSGNFTAHEAIANAPASEDGSFKVPKVIE